MRTDASYLRQPEIPKNVLSAAIAAEIEARGLTQTEAARIMDDAPSQVSLVVCGHLRGFSAERLMRMLARLGRDITVSVGPRRARGAGRIRVKGSRR